MRDRSSNPRTGLGRMLPLRRLKGERGTPEGSNRVVGRRSGRRKVGEKAGQ